MTKVLNYPTDADRDQVHNLIGSYAQGKMTRNTMMYAIAGIIEKYPNIQRMPVKNYSVRIVQYFGLQRIPIISIEGAKLSDKCPGCGASGDDLDYFRTEKERFDQEDDLISVTCLKCGWVFLNNTKNGRGQESYV
ncbi:hypothetical protein Desde_1044 [Desulfitobacterium dehalogenans ATCC 51507]|uniref:Uncharacterized protein n=1 Tax=Desulfitobacterium dehalogenans (strain ATCC 51507 / DSM 9161 / JW/IU-DC1) TaxID=756499 RepID=I4A693_DESDJ|nr:hypothetical protein [Desulfitobacterium dehalogenans]AFL99477.1 hypothetical protein Desde_1044 [Desulfitobacterium dehalogenans ATCC 51507]